MSEVLNGHEAKEAAKAFISNHAPELLSGNPLATTSRTEILQTALFEEGKEVSTDLAGAKMLINDGIEVCSFRQYQSNSLRQNGIGDIVTEAGFRRIGTMVTWFNPVGEEINDIGPRIHIDLPMHNEILKWDITKHSLVVAKTNSNGKPRLDSSFELICSPKPHLNDEVNYIRVQDATQRPFHFAIIDLSNENVVSIGYQPYETGPLARFVFPRRVTVDIGFDPNRRVSIEDEFLYERKTVWPPEYPNFPGYTGKSGK